MQVEGGYGNYRAKIVPVKKAGGRHRRLDKLIDDKFLEFYSTLNETRYQHEHRDELMVIHENNLSKKAVACLDCHKKEGYLNFSGLGFSGCAVHKTLAECFAPEDVESLLALSRFPLGLQKVVRRR